MSDQYRNGFNDRPYSYDFDEEWDVEKALRNPQPAYRSPIPVQSEHREEHHKLPKRTVQAEPISSSRPRKRASKLAPILAYFRRFKRLDNRGKLIVGGIALGAIVVLILLISLFSALFSSGDSQKTVPTPARNSVEEEVAPSDLEQLISRADRMAASYDYDGALKLLSDYGASWVNEASYIDAKNRYEAGNSTLYSWTTTENIPFLSFQSLIADPNRAFTSGNAGAYNRNMVTITEFQAILESLYAKGYVLVGLHDVGFLGTNEAGTETFMAGDIRLPEGKRPLILAQENVNYYEYMVDGDGDRKADSYGDGFAHRLVVKDGVLSAEYYASDGKRYVGAYDFAPMVDAFVREHPDFSYRGARGVLAVSGYQGIFGYRIQPEFEQVLGESAYEREIRDAQDLVKYLKANGWEIACNGYSHIAFSAMTPDEINSEITKWKNQVQGIVGKECDIMMFPYGCDIEGDGFYYSDTFNTLSDAGFRYFSATDSNNVLFGPNYFRFRHTAINGEALVYSESSLADFFDAAVLLDPARPAMVDAIG